MRYDMRILWVEDAKVFFNNTKNILQMYAEDIGLAIDFKYVQDAREFFEMLKTERDGFKIYDIFFIDYSLSSSLLGSDLIRNLRDIRVDSDILFYSSENENEIREIVVGNLPSYEGVYIANRENFTEKSNYLIQKNAKRLTSINNIRGFLMDQTSENDYTVKSYILEKFNLLTEAQKKEIEKMLLEAFAGRTKKIDNEAKEQIESIQKNGITNINKLLGSTNDLFTIDMKYKIFQKMVEYNKENAFDEYSVEEYLQKIVKARNTLAHKKLEICQMQKYILYYDTSRQRKNRCCPEECNCSVYNNEYKISVEEWDALRKNVLGFAKGIDGIQEDL